MPIDAKGYPLAWPPGWKRTPAGARRSASFGHRNRGVTVSEAVVRALRELKKMGVPDWNVIVSTNLQLRGDGLPRSDQRAPADPGAAIYWTQGEVERCIAVDHYGKVEENIAAIAATLEAMRAIERHGGAEILNRAFVGMNAMLPAPGQSSRTWREVLEIPAGELCTLQRVEQSFKRLRSQHHPDKGGDPNAFAEVMSAWQQAILEVPRAL